MRWTLIALFLLGVATCGQKGPLELPERNAQLHTDRSAIEA